MFIRILLLLVVVSGCSSQEVTGAIGARVTFTNATCPSEKSGLTALAMAVLPAVIDQGIDFIAELLEKRSTKFSATYSASNSGLLMTNCNELAEPDYQLAVNQIEFGVGPVTGRADTTYPLGFTGTPNMHLTANVKSFGQLIRVEPTSFSFNEPTTDAGKKKDVVISLVFRFPLTGVQGAGANSDELTRIVVLPVFAGVKPGDTISEISGVSSEWIPVPIPKVAVDAGDHTVPFTVTVTAKETDAGLGEALWLRLSKVIGDSKSGLKSALTNLSAGGSDRKAR